MTREEAAEIVLGQKQFSVCRVCGGEGFTNFVTNCDACLQDEIHLHVGGTGLVANPEYLEAMKVLGLTPRKAEYGLVALFNDDQD